MYESDEVDEILKVAKALSKDKNTPSKSLMEFLVERADEADCSLDELCLIIETCGATGKLADNDPSKEKNEDVADLLIDLMKSVSKECQSEKINRRKRAMALRYVSKLRGWKPYNERRLP
ncbi:MAG: hypothetical protein ACUVWN_10310 [bacterium]